MEHIVFLCCPALGGVDFYGRPKITVAVEEKMSWLRRTIPAAYEQWSEYNINLVPEDNRWEMTVWGPSNGRWEIMYGKAFPAPRVLIRFAHYVSFASPIQKSVDVAEAIAAHLRAQGARIRSEVDHFVRTGPDDSTVDKEAMRVDGFLDELIRSLEQTLCDAANRDNNDSAKTSWRDGDVYRFSDEGMLGLWHRAATATIEPRARQGSPTHRARSAPTREDKLSKKMRPAALLLATICLLVIIAVVISPSGTSTSIAPTSETDPASSKPSVPASSDLSQASKVSPIIPTTGDSACAQEHEEGPPPAPSGTTPNAELTAAPRNKSSPQLEKSTISHEPANAASPANGSRQMKSVSVPGTGSPLRPSSDLYEEKGISSSKPLTMRPQQPPNGAPTNGSGVSPLKLPSPPPPTLKPNP